MKLNDIFSLLFYLCKMEIKLEKSWEDKLEKEFLKPYFQALNLFLQTEFEVKGDAIFPAKENIFKAFNECSFEKVKVVIIGQDPYPTRGHANGLCFSVEDEIKPFPKSLLNIFKEMKSDLNIPIPLNGNLERWAKQGVLLLNSILTVREGEAGSHANQGWEFFTDEVISQLNEKKENIVYLLWGSKAHEKGNGIDTSKNLVLKSVHPSPLSSYRGFFGCKHFSKTNEYLKSKNSKEIEW